jgi:hypothetical protein
MGRPLSEMRPIPRRGAARVDLKRVVFAKSQQFDRPLVTLWRIVGVHVDCTCVIRETRTRQERGSDRPDRPPCGKIKAAKCGPVGWPKKTGISTLCNEVHFSPRPAFSDSARRINARRTSRAGAWSSSTVRARRSVVSRAFRPFGSSRVSWHAAAMVRPHQTRRLASPLRGSASGFVGRPGREK